MGYYEKRSVEECERLIALGLKLRGDEFRKTPTYAKLSGELSRLKIREIWKQ